MDAPQQKPRKRRERKPEQAPAVPPADPLEGTVHDTPLRAAMRKAGLLDVTGDMPAWSAAPTVQPRSRWCTLTARGFRAGCMSTRWAASGSRTPIPPRGSAAPPLPRPASIPPSTGPAAVRIVHGATRPTGVVAGRVVSPIGKRTAHHRVGRRPFHADQRQVRHVVGVLLGELPAPVFGSCTSAAPASRVAVHPELPRLGTTGGVLRVEDCISGGRAVAP